MSYDIQHLAHALEYLVKEHLQDIKVVSLFNHRDKTVMHLLALNPDNKPGRYKIEITKDEGEA